MKKKTLLFFAAVVVFLGGLATFAKHSESLSDFFSNSSDTNAENSRSKENPQSDNTIADIAKEMQPPPGTSQSTEACGLVTDETAFDMFFIRVVSFERAAEKARSRAESGNVWKGYLESEGFTDHDITVIRQIAQNYASEIAPLHAKALQLIKGGRDVLARTGTLPQAPAELNTLQEQRAAATIRNRDRMESLLGKETVEKVRALMKLRSNAVAVDSSNLLNSEQRKTYFRRRMGSSSQDKEDERND